MNEFIFYHGEGCGHCDAVMPFLNDVEKELNVKFIKKEIWNNEENKNEFIQNCELKMIPAFFNPENKQVVYRLRNGEEVKNWIKGQLGN